MKSKLLMLAGAAVMALAGCGGGSDSDGSASGVDTAPVFSTLNFPVRAAYDAMMDPDNPIGRNLAGTDNAAIESTTTVTQVDWPAWSKFPPPPPEVKVVAADLRWIGTITAQRRIPTDPIGTTLGFSTVAVDYTISLKRLRDGREYRDALSVYFDSDANYKPLAAVTLESRLWNWASPIEGLPFSGKVGVTGGGVATASVCGLPEFTTSLICGAGSAASPVPAIWSLQPDTASTAAITFTYRAPFLDGIDGSSTDAIVEIKTKIDSAGALTGVEYVRIEGPITIRLKG